MVIAGIDGMNGQSVTVNALPIGNSMCPAGGAQLVGGDGGSVVICNGASARSSIYGDGSAGPLNLTANADWSTTLPDNLNFSDVTIGAGVTLTVPSGVTILATGAFTNLGTIEVQPWGGGGAVTYSNEPLPDGGPGPLTLLQAIPPARGVSARAASNGATTRATTTGYTPGGLKLSAFSARKLVRVGFEGGGGGGSACLDDSCFGGSGGGTFSVRAAGAAQAGAIRANGTIGSFNCSGGGGGGVIVVVSGVSITVGAIEAKGGGGAANPAPGFEFCSAGGGGGGGIVHLIAPQIGPSTTVSVAGGFATLLYNPTVGPVSSTGSGGGACGGFGGPGGRLNAGNLDYASPGGDGLVLRTQAVDPSTLF